MRWKKFGPGTSNWKTADHEGMALCNLGLLFTCEARLTTELNDSTTLYPRFYQNLLKLSIASLFKYKMSLEGVSISSAR